MSDAVQAAQQSIELSVKALLTVLNLQYPPSHGWSRKEIAELAKQIRQRDLQTKLKQVSLDFIVRLPRLLFRTNFWSQFYLEAKYGFEAEHLAPAQDLFEKDDAELAVKHADDCLWSVRACRNLPDEKLAELLR